MCNYILNNLITPKHALALEYGWNVICCSQISNELQRVRSKVRRIFMTRSENAFKYLRCSHKDNVAFNISKVCYSHASYFRNTN